MHRCDIWYWYDFSVFFFFKCANEQNKNKIAQKTGDSSSVLDI